MKLFKKILFTCLALGATALNALSQASSGTGGGNNNYTAVGITEPWTTFAAGFGTNWAAGWTNTTYATNTQIVYSPTAGILVTNIIYYTNNSIISPSIPIGYQKDLGISSTAAASGTGSNILVFGFSVDGTLNTLDQIHTVTLVNPITTATVGVNSVTSTNIPEIAMGGYGYVTLISNIWVSASGILTNGGTAGPSYGLYYGNKRNSK